jgi:hypothetical protein
MEAYVKALMKTQRGLGLTVDMAKAEMEGAAAALADSLTAKSE